jgi:hypothetical protein
MATRLWGAAHHQGLWRPPFLSPTSLNNFPFPLSAPFSLLSSLSGWPVQAGADFPIKNGPHFASALPRRAMIRR